MTSAPVTVARSHRWRTAALIGTAGAALAAVALLTPRKAPLRVAGPSSPFISARIDSSHILRGTSETYLAVSLTAPGGTATVRPPTSVAIVLDRSGSMLGEPLDDALTSAEALIDRLGPDDELALVSFSTGSEVVLPLERATADARARAKIALHQIYAEGGTNIPAGLRDGADELSHAHAALRRMVLISDGKLEDDRVPQDRLRQQLFDLAATRASEGMSITAVGVGLDFDEEVMAGVAAAGHGNYHFVENATDLGAMFVAELGSLGETVLTHASLRIEPAAGVELLDVIGYRPTWDGSSVEIPVADLRRGDRTKVVVRIRVTAGSESVKELASVTWHFAQIGQGERTESAIARATVTDDLTVIARGRDKDTVRLVEQAKTAQALDEATVRYTDGNAEEAQRILQVRAAEAAAVAGELGDDGLREQVQAATGSASHGFAAAPPSATEGKRSSKGARADAFKLAR